MQKQKVTTGKTGRGGGGYREGEGREPFTGTGTRRGPVSQTSWAPKEASGRLKLSLEGRWSPRVPGEQPLSVHEDNNKYKGEHRTRLAAITVVTPLRSI